MGRACGTKGRWVRCIQELVGRPEVKRQLGRQRRRWRDIKMDLQDVGWRNMD